MRVDIGDKFPCLTDIVSSYYEPTEVLSTVNDALSFRLELPNECRSMIPSDVFSPYDEKSISVTVYMLDKITGKLATLYEATDNGDDRDEETDELFHFMSESDDFECFGASTFFSVRSPLAVSCGAIVSIEGTLYSDLSPAVLGLRLSWKYLEPCNVMDMALDLGKDEILAFFEKCLPWEKVPAVPPLLTGTTI